MELDIDKQGNEFLKCRGCHFLVPKEKLFLHLNNKRVQCIKSYSSSEIATLQTDWNNFKESSSYKDSKTQNTSQTFRKCGHCEEMIVCKNFDNHLKTCSGKDAKTFLFKCRGCEHVDVNFNMLVHLTANHDCVSNYVKNEFSAMFELWWNKMNFSVDKGLMIEQVNSSLEILNKLSDKKDHVFCILCGKNCKDSAIRKHRAKSEVCRKNYYSECFRPFRPNCEKCGKYYKFFIEHIHENNDCFFDSEMPRKVQDKANIQEPLDSNESSKSEETSSNVVKDEEIRCQGCDKELNTSTILRHLANKKTCKQKYSESEMSDLIANCNAYKKGTRKRRDEERAEKKLKGETDVVNCKSCGRKFNASKLNYHFSWSPECKKKYTKEDLSSLEEDHTMLKITTKQKKEQEETHKKRRQTVAKIYSQLRKLLFEKYFEKCLGTFDSRKVLHLKWQIKKLLASNPSNDVKDKLLTLIEEFDQAIEKWLDSINSRITAIGEETARWCLDFRRDLTNLTSAIDKPNCNDRAKIEKRGSEVLKTAKAEFKTIIDSNHETLCNIGKKIDMKIIPYPFVMGNMIKSKNEFDMKEGTKLLQSMMEKAKDYLLNDLKNRAEIENQQYVDFRKELEEYKYMFGDPEEVDEEGERIIDDLKEIIKEKREELKKLMEETMNGVNLSFENDFQNLLLLFDSFNSRYAFLRRNFLTEHHYFLAFSDNDFKEYIEELKERIKGKEEN